MPKTEGRAAKAQTPRRAGRTKPAHAPAPGGWLTSDADEIALRRWRGSTDLLEVVALEPEQNLFGTFRTRSASGSAYDVEIRSLDGLTNSCGCIDHRVNGLGTCKHVEGVLAALRKGRIRAFRTAAKLGSQRIELFLDPRPPSKPAIAWPAPGACPDLQPARDWLRPWLHDDDSLVSDLERIEALVAAWPTTPASVSQSVRLSRHFKPWIAAWPWP